MPEKYITSARVISSEIIIDKRVNSLGSFIAMIAQVRIILRMDNLGRIEADPQMLRSLIFPINPSVSSKKVNQICEELHNAGLFFFYASNGEMYLQSARFDRQRMVGGMKRASDLPAPAVTEFMDWLINIRKDKRFVHLEELECREQVYNLLHTGSIQGNTDRDRDCNRDSNSDGDEEAEPSTASSLNIFELYNKNIDKLTQTITDRLRDAEIEYTAEWVAAAIKEAVIYNKRSWAYIEKILERWKKEGRNEPGVGEGEKPGDFSHIYYTGALQNESEAAATWGKVLEQLQLKVTKTNYDTWLADTTGLGLNGDLFIVGVTSTFAAEWLWQRSQSMVLNALHAIAGQKLKIAFRIIEKGKE